MIAVIMQGITYAQMVCNMLRRQSRGDLESEQSTLNELHLQTRQPRPWIIMANLKHHETR